MNCIMDASACVSRLLCERGVLYVIRLLNVFISMCSIYVIFSIGIFLHAVCFMKYVIFNVFY